MRLFDIDDVPEVPLLREPRRSRGENDARFRNDYPPEWDRCPDCHGRGRLLRHPDGAIDFGAIFNDDISRDIRTNQIPPPLIERGYSVAVCGRCLGMGSEKRKSRLLAGFRCERCLHPYLGKGDMKQLGKVELASNHRWSPCDSRCVHGGPLAFESGVPVDGYGDVDAGVLVQRLGAKEVLAEWRILTVHHLTGDKADLSWWNLAVLCQRCHLEIQAKVVMERIYPHEHSPWFKPHAAGYYASVYLCATCGRRVDDSAANHLPVGAVGDHGLYPHEFVPLQLTREETLARMDEMLALEAAYV